MALAAIPFDQLTHNTKVIALLFFYGESRFLYDPLDGMGPQGVEQETNDAHHVPVHVLYS